MKFLYSYLSIWDSDYHWMKRLKLLTESKVVAVVG